MKEKKSGQLKYKVFSRINKHKYKQLQSMLKASHCRTISELIRNILEDGKITLVTHDATLDNVMEELSGIRKELQSIGININQVTRRFHIEDQPEGKIFQALEIARLYQQTEQKVTELFAIISKLSTRWLPE